VADAQGEFETLVAKWRAGNIEVLPGVSNGQLLALGRRDCATLASLESREVAVPPVR
jgi:hypothetical protein